MLNILIVDSVCNKSGIINKDVNGGLGTRSQFGKGILLKSYMTKFSANLTIILSE